MSEIHTQSGAGGRGQLPTLLAPIQVVVRDGDPTTLTVEVRGELDLATAPLVEQHLEPFLGSSASDGHERRVVYQLADCSFIDLTGLDTLLIPGEGGKSVTFSEPSRPVRRLLALMGMESMIEPGPDETA